MSKKKAHKQTRIPKSQPAQNIKRIPRPQGITMLCKNKEDPQKIKQIIIKQWAQNNLSLNGKVYSVEQMAHYINLPEQTVYKYLWKQFDQTGKFLSRKSLHANARGLFGLGLKKILESDALIRNQIQILTRSQGADYKPFISTAVNQILATLVTSNNQIPAFLKFFLDRIPNNPLGSSEANLDQNITTQQALEIIESQAGSQEAYQLPEQFHIPGLPDIDPNTQDAGLYMAPKLNLGSPAEGTVGPVKAPDPKNPQVKPKNPQVKPDPRNLHENRRQSQESILDEEDEEDFVA